MTYPKNDSFSLENLLLGVSLLSHENEFVDTDVVECSAIASAKGGNDRLTSAP